MAFSCMKDYGATEWYLRDFMERMKTEAPVQKGKVISAQEKFLECKTEQRNNIRSAIETTVQ